MTTKTQTDTPPMIKLAERCIAHLEKEEASLQKYVRTARRVQELIVEGKPIDEHESAALEADLQIEANDLAAQRETLRSEIAKVLNKPPHAVSIKAFATKLDPDLRREILQRRESIIELTQTIERINRTNSVLIQQTIDLQQRLHLAITGKDHSAPTYGSRGQLNKQSASSVIETEC